MSFLIKPAIISAVIISAALLCGFSGYHETVLPSGARVVTIPDPASRTSSVNIWVGAGSADETKGEEGISHFLEHLFFRGVEGKSGSEFKSAIEAIGGSANAETSKDYTRYYINVPSENTLRALELLISTMRSASFSKDEIDVERKVVLEEYRINEAAPMTEAYNKLFSLAYGGHPYSKPVIGLEANIKRFTRNDVLSYREKFYSPSNLVFVVSGRFSEKDVVSLVSNAFSSPGPQFSGKSGAAAFTPLAKTASADLKRSGTPMVMMGYYGPPAADEKRLCAADVLCFLLGKGEGSVFSGIRSGSDGKIKTLSVDFQTMRDPGLIILSASGDVGKAELEKTISDAVKKVSGGGFSDSELARAKRLLSRTYLYSLETNDGKASCIGLYSVLGRTAFAAEYPDLIRAVSREDVIKMAKSISGDPAVLVTLGKEGAKK